MVEVIVQEPTEVAQRAELGYQLYLTSGQLITKTGPKYAEHAAFALQ